MLASVAKMGIGNQVVDTLGPARDPVLARSRMRVLALDGLRFLAACMVVSYHYISSYLPPDASPDWALHLSRVTRYGYLGVELFFLISGFVILWSAEGRKPASFAISRISRLYPSFWAAVLLTSCVLVVASTVAPEVSATSIGWDRLARNLTMLPSVLGAVPIDGVYWTLEIEIRFYALIFLVLVTGQIHRIELWLYLWLALSALALWVPIPNVIGFLIIMPYGPLFAGGCLIFLGYSRGWSPKRAVALAICMSLACLQSVRTRADFIDPDAISRWVVPVVVASFFGVFLLLLKRTSKGSGYGITYRLGALTYPLYLTHAALGAVAIEFMLPSYGTATTMIVVTLAALVVAHLMVVTIDKPAREPLRRACYRGLTFLRYVMGILRRRFRFGVNE